MGRRLGGSPTVRALVAVVVLLLVLAPRAPYFARAATVTVHIGDTLDPKDLAIVPGTTVTWVNDSGDRHRVRSTSGPSEFDSGDMDPGQAFTFTFSGTGTWQYVDDRNKDLSNYWGTVTSAEKPMPTPRPTPTPPPGATPPPPTPTPPPPGDILMAGRAFSPSTLTVDPGTVVRWRNNDSREHTVTSTGTFDSGIMAVGATFRRTFTTAGTYRYLCAIHPDMTGTITVRTAAGATPPPPPPATPTPPPTAPPPTPAPGSNTVAVVDFAFNPTPIDVVAGATVTWINNGAAIHTVTASDGSFDSGFMAAGGGRFQRRFSTPGTFPYLCALHPSMTGVVRVSGANGATPPPAASPTPAPTPPSARGANELRDFAFVPSSIRVTPGTTVTWVNTGAAPHTVTDRAGAFDSGLLVRGARWSRTFTTPGTYQLLCSIHPEMHATLVVAAPGATPPPPATPRPVQTPLPGSGEVAIVDFDFAPKTLHVDVGATVRWVNRGVAPHTVTAKDSSYDSGFLSTGDGFAHRYTAPGIYEYLCANHPAMIGTVVVGAATAEPSPSASGSPQPSAVPAGSPAPSDGVAPAGSAGAGGVPPDTTGGAGGQPPALVIDAVARPLTADAWLRLGLVALIGLAGVGVFVGIVRGVARGA